MTALIVRVFPNFFVFESEPGSHFEIESLPKLRRDAAAELFSHQ